jgi:signal transduction histidine kinase
VTPRPFQLTRYFTLASLAAFAVLGAALFFVQRGEESYFERVQGERGAFLAKAQADLLQEQKDAARASLITAHEAGHVALARVFANALWASHLGRLVAQAQAVEPCSPAADAPRPPRKDCQTAVRARVTALPAFAGIDAPVRALMRQTTVFKVKVYDLRGLTVYSSELAQVGEDKSGNAGWRSAVGGRPASELVHRNQFSAFEGMVKDRDLIQSYIPVSAPGGRIVGVFELYSDVTPLLQQLNAAAARSAAMGTRNEARLKEAAAREQQHVVAASNRFLLAIVGLLVLTYAALLLLVRRGQLVIDREAEARAQAALREQEWHRDKMATMGAMAAHISHQVGNPLAAITEAAEEIGRWRTPDDIRPEAAHRILEQATRIAGMTHRINEFAQAGGLRPEPLDINRHVELVCQFIAFDRRFHGTPIDLRLPGGLAPCRGIPDQLTEVMMNLLQAFEKGCAQCATPRGRLQVETAQEGDEVAVRISGECAMGAGCSLPATEPRLDSARQRLRGMGGRIAPYPGGLEIRLGCSVS